MWCVNVTYCFDDVIGSESNVLDTCPSIVPDVFFNLTHSFPRGRLVNGHLDGALPISDHHRPQTAELCVDLRDGMKGEAMDYGRAM